MVIFITFSKPAFAQVCTQTTCYEFDTITSITSSNLGFNILDIRGVVKGVNKTAIILLDKDQDPHHAEVLNRCNKNGLLAQVSPGKVRLVFQSNEAESNNSLAITIPGSASYQCTLLSL